MYPTNTQACVHHHMYVHIHATRKCKYLHVYSVYVYVYVYVYVCACVCWMCNVCGYVCVCTHTHNTHTHTVWDTGEPRTEEPYAYVLSSYAYVTSSCAYVTSSYGTQVNHELKNQPRPFDPGRAASAPPRSGSKAMRQMQVGLFCLRGRSLLPQR